MSILKMAGAAQTLLAFLRANRTLTALPDMSRWLHSYYAPEYAEQLIAELSARFNTKHQNATAELESTSTQPASYQPEEKADLTPEPLVEDNSVRLNENYTDAFYAGLALDGEGLQVLLTAPVIKRLEEELRCPMYKLFDCIAGTSFGGIIALGLTASRDGSHPLLKTEKLIQLFLEQTEDIFPGTTKR